MPLVTIQYNLPSEDYEHRCAVNGSKYLLILQEITTQFRSLQKYPPDCNAEITWGDAYDRLFEIFKEFNFDPWEE